jgi:hypothetical protein
VGYRLLDRELHDGSSNTPVLTGGGVSGLLCRLDFASRWCEVRHRFRGAPLPPMAPLHGFGAADDSKG